jgi:ATP-dependent Lon protease
MPRDAKSKLSTNKKRQNKRQEEASRKKKKDESSDDEEDYIIESDDEDDEEDEEDIMDELEYKKFLKKMFPSKHMDKQVNSAKRLKKMLREEAEDEDEEDEEDEDVSQNVVYNTRSRSKKQPKSKNVKNVKNVKKEKKSKPTKKKEESEEEEDSEEDEEDEEDDDEDDEDVYERDGSSKFNIIFTIGGADEDEEEWETDDEDDMYADEDTEDEDVSVSDSDEEEDEEEEEENSERDEKLVSRKNKNKKNTNKTEKAETSKASTEKKAPAETMPTKQTTALNDNDEFLLQLKELQEKHQSNPLASECLKICESSMQKTKEKRERKTKKQQEKNSRIFKKIVRDKNTLNDFEFFKNIGVEEQKKIIKELREINKITRVEKPYRMTLLDSDMPVLFKGAAMKKINTLRYMEPGSGEYYKIKNWVDTFMRVPFGKYQNLPVNINDGIETCHEFMAKAKETLNDAVYGLNDAKMQIMQMLGQLVTNPSAIGTAIAIHGSMGTGKTTLVKEGISKILNRPFAFIALGGATDSSFLEGHSYTYEGSTWGKIVQILIDSKCMNPVIYFDELDKISDTPKGEEIAGILTHLTDTTQNSQFHDKYFAEVDFDLSKCLFIFSYNDEKKVNPILRDRMYRICTKGYDKKQKTVISNKYLLPKIREQVKFADSDIIIPDEVLHYIMETHCSGEEGVRNLKRCLEIIYTKLNLYRLMKPGMNLFEEDMSLAVEFPFTVSKAIVDKLIVTERNDNMALKGMYV